MRAVYFLAALFLSGSAFAGTHPQVAGQNLECGNARLILTTESEGLIGLSSELIAPDDANQDEFRFANWSSSSTVTTDWVAQGTYATYEFQVPNWVLGKAAPQVTAHLRIINSVRNDLIDVTCVSTIGN